jgi:Glycosyl hydrolases family 38 N-terminal domain
MTTRLLTRSGRAPGARTVQEALAATSLTAFAQVNGVTVAGAALPLFRHGAAPGTLDQIVRLTFQPVPDDVQRIELRRPDGSTAVSWTGSLPRTGVLDLAAPEVRTPQTWTAVLTVAGVQHQGELAVTPGRKLTVHLVHHSHLDIGYTDTQGVVLRNHWEYLDAAVELACRGADHDSATRFRWTVESNLPVRSWLRRRPGSVVEEFCRLVREDVIEVTAMPFNLHTEMASQEELSRLLRTVGELRDEFDIPIRSAMHTDVPGATTGWVDALVEAGVRYLSAAHNWAGRSVPYLVGGQRLTRPFWWRSPSGARLLTWFTDSAHGAAYMEGNLVGLSDSYDDTLALLPLYLQALVTRPFPFSEAVFGLSGIPADVEVTKEPYAYDLVQLRVQGRHSDNAAPSITPAEIARRWNSEWAYPRLVTSTNGAFLAAAEELVGADLAEHTGDWGDWWADGVGSGARPLGYNRRAQGILRTAETVHTLADLQSGTLHPVRDTIDAIYDKVGLFDEHTWGAANPWHDHEHGTDSGGLQWTRKQEFAYQAYDDALDLLHAGVRRLGAGVGTPTFTQVLGSLAVYNTTGWPRSDVVRAFVPESHLPAGKGLLAVVDTRKDERVATRVTTETRTASPRGRHLEFVAREVPPLGWVRFDLVFADNGSELGGGGPADVDESTGRSPDVLLPGDTHVAEVAEPVGADNERRSDDDGRPTPKAGYRLANDYYELTYDPTQAMVTSIVDRRSGRELVNPVALTGLNEYIFDTYGSAANVNHLSGRLTATDLALLTSRQVARHAVVVRSEHSDLCDLLEVEVKGAGVDWMRTTIAMYEGVPRIDITNRIGKPASSSKESIYFAFPLAADSEPMFELTGSVAGAGVPQLPGAPEHMRGIRHWAGVSAEGYSIAWATLEAPLVQFGTIALPYQPFPATVAPERPEPATVYSWALNNIWDTNFPSQQQGEMTFHYAVAGSAEDPVHVLGATTAAGLTEPLVPVLATGRGTAPLVSSGSLLAVSRPDVVVSSVGRPRDGSEGLAVRLRSLAVEALEVDVTLEGYEATSASLTTLLERGADDLEIEDGRVTVPLPAGSTRTLLLRP